MHSMDEMCCKGLTPVKHASPATLRHLQTLHHKRSYQSAKPSSGAAAARRDAGQGADADEEHVSGSAQCVSCLSTSSDVLLPETRSLPDLQLMDETRGRGLDAHKEHVTRGAKDP